jgi:hypothetical protein
MKAEIKYSPERKLVGKRIRIKIRNPGRRAGFL